MLRVLALTRYGRLGASSRLRTYEYIPRLATEGISVDVSPLLSGSYLRSLYAGRSTLGEVLVGFGSRVLRILTSRSYDLLWIEKELFPFLPAMTERVLGMVGLRYVVDYDDAIFHRYDNHRSAMVRGLLGRKIDAVMRGASVVIAGNAYIAERARQAGARRVEILPTAVDLQRYQPRASAVDSRPVTIGWIGSPVTARYLRLVSRPLADLQHNLQVNVSLIGSGPVEISSVAVNIMPWNEEEEAQQIASFDIGIMPLPDEPWERGKCGYKLIQYMAAAVPTVGSPVGVNAEVIQHGETGYLARTEEEWTEYLRRLVLDTELRRRFGAKGRLRAEERYSAAVMAQRLASILKRSAAT